MLLVTIITLITLATLVQGDPIIPPAPEFIVSCPGKKQTGATTTTCADTPIRTQMVLSVATLQAAGLANDCVAPSYDTTSSSSAACNDDGFDCYDNRDCCSSFCDWSVDTAGAQQQQQPSGYCAPPGTTGAQGGTGKGQGTAYNPDDPSYNTGSAYGSDDDYSTRRRMLLSSSISASASVLTPHVRRRALRLGVDRRRFLDKDDDHASTGQQPCYSNSECLSYRCLNKNEKKKKTTTNNGVVGYCDDAIGDTYAGFGSTCFPANLRILYTVELEGEPTPGDPSMSNPYTLSTALGDYQEMSFPGTITVRARTEYCNYEENCMLTNSCCTLSSVIKMTVLVSANGPKNNANGKKFFELTYRVFCPLLLMYPFEQYFLTHKFLLFFFF